MQKGGIRDRLSFANAVSLVSLFVALSAGAYAAGLAKDSVKAKQIKANAVGAAEIKAGAVASDEVLDGSLRSGDFASGQIPAGAQGPQGVEGPQGPRGEQGPAGRSALSELQSGETVRGVVGMIADADVAGDQFATVVSLPVPAPVALDDAHVSVDGEEDPGNQCVGSAASPTAPAGFACVYPMHFVSVQTLTTIGKAIHDPSRFGFRVEWNSFISGATGFKGTWAYTAP